jgi:hypothetical protein
MTWTPVSASVMAYTPGGTEGTAIYTVPEGQMLVVQYVACSRTGMAGKVWAWLQALEPVTEGFDARVGEWPLEFSADGFISQQLMTIYVPEGRTLWASFVGLEEEGGDCWFKFSMSGYLISMPAGYPTTIEPIRPNPVPRDPGLLP